MPLDLEFNAVTGSPFAPAEYLARLSQEIWDIALTRRGSRPGQPGYGLPGATGITETNAPGAASALPGAVADALAGVATVTDSDVRDAILYIMATAPGAPFPLRLHAALRGPDGTTDPVAGVVTWSVSPDETLRCPVDWVRDAPAPTIVRIEAAYDDADGDSVLRLFASAPALYDHMEDGHQDAWDDWYIQWSVGAFSVPILLQRPGTPVEMVSATEYRYDWPLPAHRLADMRLADQHRTDPWLVYIYRYGDRV